MEKPRQTWAGLCNISFGFFGIQIGFALQNANMSRVFQSLGSSIDDLPALWVAAPLTGLLVQPVIGHLSDRTWLGRLGRAVLRSRIRMPSVSIVASSNCIVWGRMIRRSRIRRCARTRMPLRLLRSAG